ncbi:MAG: DUF819 family protein [Ruminococcus sp.]|uniref:DUF819 family protein n=1 Tax=Schaedlerella arabinosiphila TaxID=2044587 RepID=A0A426DPZ2_9FIRM|nr:DUF819 family protein [Schaedlerella arabinosiphila]MCI8722603.1 DUF819 family protein [Ruminococcus sp.]MCI9212781.1 DUF819 family protein [Ruminococcus sp.]RRK34820.1 DUF819 family protein [Schaedlerella arabinosiphila]
MQFPIFQSTDAMLTVILMMVAFSLWVQKFKLFKYVGPALTVIILGMILVNLHIVPGAQDVYGVVITYCVPMSISIYLLNVNLKELAKLSGKALAALLSAVFSVCLMATLFGAVFGGKMFEGWKIAGMFVGTYTGGSGNLTAIAVGLDAANDTIAAANAADYVIGMPTMFLMFAAPALFQNVKFLKKVWPYELEEKDRVGEGDHPVLMGDEKWSIKDIAWLLAISVLIVTVATKLSAFMPSDFASAGRVLLISTFSIIAAQIPFVSRLRGNINLGLFFGLMYLAIIGFSVDLASFFSSTMIITVFCFCVIIGSILLHLLISRLCKVPYEYVILGITGAIADGTTASLVASSAKWNRLISVGLLMGVVGGVCGNYLGILVAYVIRAIIGA